MLNKVFVYILGAIAMVSCSESFNSIYEDVEEKDPNVVPPEELNLKNVNILPTLSDPLYNIESTRFSGGGPFDSYDKDREHWLNTRFKVFGLLTGNKAGGAPDYAAAETGDRQYGVLWNQTMGISDQQGHTIFYDAENKPVSCKYNPDDKLYRYKFFLLGTDGLNADIRVDGNNTLVARMDLDGVHDVMQSFAYHTENKYAEEVGQLPDDETTKVFLDGGRDNLYNRMSGNRGLHPIFNVRHLLSRFDIRVKGGNPQLDKTCDFLRIFVKDVSIKAAKKVDVTVADDSWERDEYIEKFQTNRLITQIGQPVPYALTIVPNAMRNTPFTVENRGDIDFDFLNEESYVLSEQIGESVIPEGSHWVGSTVADSLCKTVFIPPLPTDDGHFVLSFKYRYVYMHYDRLTGKYHIGQGGGLLNKQSVWEEFDESITIPNVDLDGNTVVYEGGKKYTIVVTVYGKSVVMVDVLQPTKWEDGGNIDVEGY